MNDTPLAVIGLGYVGLPVAVAFGRRRPRPPPRSPILSAVGSEVFVKRSVQGALPRPSSLSWVACDLGGLRVLLPDGASTKEAAGRMPKCLFGAPVRLPGGKTSMQKLVASVLCVAIASSGALISGCKASAQIGSTP